MFASNTIVEHLARGFAGLGALALAMIVAATHPVVALLLLPVALVALRGCPTCWAIGLLETIAAKAQGRKPPTDVCADGACTIRESRSSAPRG